MISRRYLLRHGAASATFYLAVVAGLYAFQDRLVYPGAFMEMPEGLEVTYIDPSFSETAVPGTEGPLFALHAAPAPRKSTVIAFHGNGMYPEDFFWAGSRLASRGIGFLAVAYRGYPRSGGRPSEEGIHADARAAYDWVRRTYPDSAVHVLGHSLGTGVAISLASDKPVASVLLVSPYRSIMEEAWKRLPFVPIRLLLRSQFRSDLAIGRVTAPVFAWHGTEDRVIGIASGRALMQLAPEGSVFVPVEGAGHGDILASQAVIDGIVAAVEGSAQSR